MSRQAQQMPQMQFLRIPFQPTGNFQVDADNFSERWREPAERILQMSAANFNDVIRELTGLDVKAAEAAVEHNRRSEDATYFQADAAVTAGDPRAPDFISNWESVVEKSQPVYLDLLMTLDSITRRLREYLPRDEPRMYGSASGVYSGRSIGRIVRRP